MEVDSSRDQTECPKLDCDSLPANQNACVRDVCDVPPPFCPDPIPTPCIETVDDVNPSVAPQSRAFSQIARVKRGYRELSSSLTCGVVFESDPVWLWSLRPNSWSIIYVTDPDEPRLRQDHPALYDRLSCKLKTIVSTFRGDFPTISPDCMWISGCRRFLEMVEIGDSGHHVYWMSHSPRRCPSDGIIGWTRVLHRNVGGVTEARGTFGIHLRSPKLELEKDLTRSLGHVIKYSIRPRVCDPNGGVETCYTRDDLLSLSFPRRPVLFPTHMSRTGWGMRPLDNSELLACFELPDYIAWQDRFLRDIVPLQLFRSVIDSVLGDISYDAPRRSPALTATPIPNGASRDVIWLSKVGRWLPGSWADAYISDKAVKSDNAPIDFRPWNRRIQLVLPCLINTIQTFERFASRRWRFNVCRSLFAYLRYTHGLEWIHALCRQTKRAFSDPLTGNRKRRRGAADSPRKSLVGGGCVYWAW